MFHQYLQQFLIDRTENVPEGKSDNFLMTSSDKAAVACGNKLEERFFVVASGDLSCRRTSVISFGNYLHDINFHLFNNFLQITSLQTREREISYPLCCFPLTGFHGVQLLI